MAKVSLKNVFKIYPGDAGQEVTAVSDFNLEIADREFIVFVGPSGCGKSTTLRMIAGLEEISRGDVVIGDRRINDVPPKDRDIAMVFQNYALYPHLSVEQNLGIGLKLRKYPHTEIKGRVDAAAAILGLEAYLDRKPKALSGGQRQRVAVGRAIVRHPKVFLFDEPLSNLDAKMRVQMRTEITKLHQRLQATMIYVTHDQVEAMTMGDRIVVMKDGFIQQIAPPLTIYRQPANIFVAGFIGSPPMNFVTGRLYEGTAQGGPVFKQKDGGIIQCSLPRYNSACNYIGKEVVLGIRPESLFIIEEGQSAATCIETEIDMVEPMGSETHLTFQTGDTRVTCRSERQIDQSYIGKTIQFGIQTDRLHLFDPETTNRIVPSEE